MALLVASLLLALAPTQQTSPPAKPVTLVPVVNEAPLKAGHYDWLARHKEVVERMKKGDVGMVMIGDSITHGWNKPLWDKHYAPRNAVNMGFGWDGTQHVLWRLQNGEVDGISPKVAVLMIGVNNIWASTSGEIALGIEEIVKTLRAKLPTTQVLVLGTFPTQQSPDSPRRKQVADINVKVAEFVKTQKNVTFLDISKAFLEKDGTISPEIMGDFVHLTPKGYMRWYVWMEPTLKRLMGEG